MKVQGQLTEEEVLQMIADKLLLRTMKGIVEDEVYTDEQKYLIIEGMLSQWEKDQKKESTEGL